MAVCNEATDKTQHCSILIDQEMSPGKKNQPIGKEMKLIDEIFRIYSLDPFQEFLTLLKKATVRPISFSMYERELES